MVLDSEPRLSRHGQDAQQTQHRARGAGVTAWSTAAVLQLGSPRWAPGGHSGAGATGPFGRVGGTTGPLGGRGGRVPSLACGTVRFDGGG